MPSSGHRPADADAGRRLRQRDLGEGEEHVAAGPGRRGAPGTRPGSRSTTRPEVEVGTEPPRPRRVAAPGRHDEPPPRQDQRQQQRVGRAARRGRHARAPRATTRPGAAPRGSRLSGPTLELRCRAPRRRHHTPPPTAAASDGGRHQRRDRRPAAVAVAPGRVGRPDGEGLVHRRRRCRRRPRRRGRRSSSSAFGRVGGGGRRGRAPPAVRPPAVVVVVGAPGVGGLAVRCGPGGRRRDRRGRRGRVVVVVVGRGAGPARSRLRPWRRRPSPRPSPGGARLRARRAVGPRPTAGCVPVAPSRRPDGGAFTHGSLAGFPSIRQRSPGKRCVPVTSKPALRRASKPLDDGLRRAADLDAAAEGGPGRPPP